MVKEHIFLFGGYNDSSELYLSTLQSMNIPFQAMRWNEVLHAEDKAHSLDHPDTLVRMDFPWDDPELSIDYFGVSQSLGEQYQKFRTLMGKARSIFPRSYFPVPPESAIALRDKRLTSLILETNNIQTPHLYMPQSFEEFEEILEKEDTLFIKPNSGTQGQGTGVVYRNKNGTLQFRTNYKRDSHRLIQGKKARSQLEELIALKEEMLVQTYISPLKIDDRKFDMRVLVSYGEPIFSYARIATGEDSVSTNISQGASSSIDFEKMLSPKAYQMSQDLAVKTAQAFTMDFTGVDIIFDENERPYVIEANAFPGTLGPRKYGVNPFAHELSRQYSWDKLPRRAHELDVPLIAPELRPVLLEHSTLIS